MAAGLTVLSHGVIYRAQNPFFGYQGWPSVTQDENGVLYAAASAFRCRHICPFGKTAMFVSRDGGQTWTPPVVVNDTAMDDRDAGILYLGGGRLLVSWFVHPAEAYLNDYYDYMKKTASAAEAPAVLGMLDSFWRLSPEEAKGGSFVRVSEDYGVTWGETVRVPVSAPHGPILRPDGTLLYLGKEFCSYGAETPDVIAAYVSADGGCTWTRKGLCEKPAEFGWDRFYEPHAVCLPDGSIVGMIRAEGNDLSPSFTMFSTRSADGGATWSPWRPTGVNGSPPHLLLHSSGALVCVFGRRSGAYGEYALVSRDGGETWPEEYALDTRSPNGDLGYPASTELADGSILTVYYQKYQRADGSWDEKPSILCTRWRLN